MMRQIFDNCARFLEPATRSAQHRALLHLRTSAVCRAAHDFKSSLVLIWHCYRVGGNRICRQNAHPLFCSFTLCPASSRNFALQLTNHMSHVCIHVIESGIQIKPGQRMFTTVQFSLFGRACEMKRSTLRGRRAHQTVHCNRYMYKLLGRLLPGYRSFM